MDEYLQRFPELAARLRECFAPQETRPIDPKKEETRALGGETTLPKSEATEGHAAGWPAIPGYEFLEYLGGGGMGVVYKVRQVRLDRVVVLKVIHTRYQQDAGAVARFHREMQAAARLAHPNLVSVHDAGQAGETHYFAMEHVDGMDLSRLVRKYGVLPVEQACEYVRQASLGLHHAHERGLVHRDVKPGNLVVTADRTTVKVLDLGLARLMDRGSDEDGGLTVPGMLLGTPDYMAPEQLRDSRTVDARADLYGLGCTLYFLLTGQVPYPGNNPGEKMAGHLSGTPRPIEELRPDVSAPLATLVRRLMARRPEDRFQRADEVAAALLALRSPGHPTRRHRWYAPAALAGCILIAIALVAWMVLTPPSKEPASSPGVTVTTGAAREPTGIPTGSAEEAAAALVKLGAKIDRDKKRPGEPVTAIDLEFAPVKDRDLALLAALTELEQIALPPGTNDAGLAHLRGLTRLQWLGLAKASITDAGLASVEGLKDLRWLWLDGCKVGDAGLVHLRGLRNLVTLSLGDTDVGDAGLRLVAELPNVWFLRLADTRVTDEGLSLLRQSRQLGTLDLSGLKISRRGLAHLENLPHLQHLVLDRATFDDGDARPLGEWTQLLTLDLCDVHLSDHGLEFLKGLTRLESLALNRTAIGEVGVASLEGLTQLKKLDLVGTKVGDHDLRRLTGLSRLESLNLSETAVTDRGMEDLSALATLTYLDLSGTVVGDPGLKPFARMKNLRDLIVRGTRVTPAGIQDLKTALPELQITP